MSSFDRGRKISHSKTESFQCYEIIWRQFILTKSTQKSQNDESIFTFIIIPNKIPLYSLDHPLVIVKIS